MSRQVYCRIIILAMTGFVASVVAADDLPVADGILNLQQEDSQHRELVSIEPIHPAQTGNVSVTVDRGSPFRRFCQTTCQVLRPSKLKVGVYVDVGHRSVADTKISLNAVMSVESSTIGRVTHNIRTKAGAGTAQPPELKTDLVLPVDVQEKLRDQLLEEPAFVVCGTEFPGPPVWYVNGMLTRKQQATAAGEEVSGILHRRIHVLYNPTFVEWPFKTGTTIAGFSIGDLAEATYDRLWPALTTGRLLSQMTTGKACPEPLQANPTVRQLAWILFHSREGISIVTHSQGCLIARNAFFSLAILGQESKVRNRVAWVAAGIPLHDSEIWPRPTRTTVLDHRDDPVAKLVGLRQVGAPYQWKDHGFAANYARQITNAMIFPESDGDED